ncbi:hypothetical protein C0993_000911 [Termitomyces sp. T159_Od127]|nr:hypothetical protein C0993_000911 [Termitomyces sp. T159_Od127]
MDQDKKASVQVKGEVIYSDNDMESSKDPDKEKKSLSKKKQHKLVWLMVVELKQLIKKPEVVEWTDAITADPPPPCRWTSNAVWHGNTFGHGQCCLYHYAGPQSLYQVVPEKQTLVWGLMGSKRGYNISAVLGAVRGLPFDFHSWAHPTPPLGPPRLALDPRDLP